MQLNIAKLKAAGFYVSVDGETISIEAPQPKARDWDLLKAQVKALGIKDPGLVDYVMGSFMTTAQRAQILEMAE